MYLPGNTSIDERTLCNHIEHYGGAKEFDIHNFNGFLESFVTYKRLKSILNTNMPFILSRSTVPGSGKFAIHWTGDNVSKFDWMKMSISSMINFNLFGIPNTGADICGFMGNIIIMLFIILFC